jgi:NAD(P)-dependent dehydrogenase (short-subunit alcohol dehydrogenase family)
LITGASSGIGYDAAITLHQRGYRVMASVRKEADKQRLQALGLSCVLMHTNDPQSIAQGFAETIDTFGRLDFLFNNAAYGQPGAVEDLSWDALKEQFETNLFGMHELNRLAIAQMRKQGQGRIIMTSSVLGYVAMPYRGAYNASKFALEGLVDTARLELKNTGIQLILLEPGPIESRFRANAFLAYEKHIAAEQSPHAANYTALKARLMKEGHAAPFTLPASAVTRDLIHALEAKKPKLRYRQTFPAKLFWWLKRLLPTRWMDALLYKSGDGGAR